MGRGSSINHFLNHATVDADCAAIPLAEFGVIELRVERAGESHGAHNERGLVKADQTPVALLPRLALGLESRWRQGWVFSLGRGTEGSLGQRLD